MKKYIFVFLISIVSVSAFCQEMKIAVKAIPSAILQSFRSAYSHARIISAAKETTKGETVYEINCNDAKTSRTISFNADGKIVETEETITVDKLPDPVTNTITKEFPKGKILKIEQSVKDSKTYFEVLIKNKGKKVEAVILPDGKIQQGE